MTGGYAASAAVWMWGFWIRVGDWIVGVDRHPPSFSERHGRGDHVVRVGGWRFRAGRSP